MLGPCARWQTSSSPASPAAGRNVTGLVQGPYILCLSQVQVIGNPAEPYELQIQYSEMALHKLNLLLIYYRTDTLKILDGQLECKCAGNK